MKDYQRRRIESIAYIQQMLGELRTMAEIERCDMLTYLIEMAYVEAGDIRRGTRPMRVRSTVRPVPDPRSDPGSGQHPGQHPGQQSGHHPGHRSDQRYEPAAVALKATG